MQDFEKLGAFYLGKRFDVGRQQLTDELVLYDSKDLSTHAVIVGMTGSGKTGLGIGLIEEAAIDRVPVIAIDPKGDLGNLALAFPQLAADDFAPWVDPRAALDAGQSVAELAGRTAARWRQGLADWGQTPERITRLRAGARVRIFTPGSTAGRPLSVLGSLQAPSPELAADPDLFRELVDTTVMGLLSLAGIEADPLADREHILLATLLGRVWQEGRSLDLAGLIAAVQQPEVSRIGVMDIDTFYPPKERFALAMRFNAMLASPGFQPWFEGEPLDVDRLLYTEQAHPCVSVMSIAHLDDRQRMFFVTMLLGKLLAWVRRQPGTPSLRALLYMDEVFGFMPPVAEPPSKRLLLTLLKQARAYGVGVVLATQNPADLDYKGLANAGTWFIGRLQTERDRLRVVEGLKSAAGGGLLAEVGLDEVLTGLGQRRFLLHNVHERGPMVFETRWVMSYLSGPLTRDQLRQLCLEPEGETNAALPTPIPAAASVEPSRPLLPPDIRQVFVAPPIQGTTQGMRYAPRLLAQGSLRYVNSRLGVDQRRDFAFFVALDDEHAEPDWAASEAAWPDPTHLSQQPVDDGVFEGCPPALTRAVNYVRWEKGLRQHLRSDFPLLLYKSPSLKLTSQPGETERDFRIRLQRIGKERRDAEVARLKQRYEKQVAQLEARLLRSEHALEREQQQASGQTVDTLLSFGTAVLGAVLGRRRVSASAVTRVGTAVRKAGRSRKEQGDVRRAEENVARVRAALDELAAAFESELDALEQSYDAETEPLEELRVAAKTGDIQIGFIGLGWVGTALPRQE